MVHVGLESGWRVAEFKEHNGWLVESERCGEGRLPSVFWSDQDVIISPSDVEFCEEFAIFEFIY